jgi:hypothetical protein
MTLLAGVATRDITKRESKTSAFNALDQAVECTEIDPESLACPVMAKALVLRGSGEAVAIVTLDVVAIGSIGHVSDAFLRCFRARAASELGLTNVLVTASHCHGVPCDDYEVLAFAALKEAAGACVRVRIGAGRSREVDVSENRRIRLATGGEVDMRHAYSLPPSSEVGSVGAIDPEIGLLRLDRADSGGADGADGTFATLALLYNFSCHPIQGVPSEANCADLSGYASRVVEEGLGGGAVALFLQGCCGDINPLGYKDVRTPRHAKSLGTTLGLSVLRGARAIHPTEPGSGGEGGGGGVLRLLRSSVALPRVAAAARIAALEKEIASAFESLEGTFLDLDGFVALTLQHALSPACPSAHASRYLHDKDCRGCDDLLHHDAANRAHLAAYRSNCRIMERLTRAKTNLALLRKHQAVADAAGGAPIAAELSALRVGEFVLLTFPGELASEIGVALKAASPHAHTFVAGYTNGYIFYCSTEAQLSNCCTAQEDCDCMVAPGWRHVFEAEAHAMLAKV